MVRITLLAALLLTSTAAAAADVTVAFNDTTNIVRLAPGVENGVTTMVLTLTNVPEAARGAMPDIKDIATGGRGTVVFEPGLLLQRDSTVVWTMKVTVSGAARDTSESRLAKVTFGSSSYSRSYTLTNRAAGTPGWSAAGPGVPWISTWETGGSRLAINVTSQDLPLGAIEISQSTLRDAFNLTQIGPDNLTIEGADNIAARSVTTILVSLKPGGVPLVGKFSGNVVLKSKNTTDVQTVGVTLYSSSIILRAIGAVLLLTGLWCSWYVLHRIIPSAARAQAMKAVFVTRMGIDGVAASLTALPAVPNVRYAVILNRLSQLRERVSTARLDAESLLPKGFDLPIGTAGDATAKLADRLAAVNAEAAAVSVVVVRGIVVAVADFGTGHFDQARVVTALGELDVLGGTAATQAEALAKLPAILASYQTDLAAKTVAARPVDPITLAQADFVIEHASRAAWLLWAVAAGLVGIVMLVLQNSGFGWIDLAYCFLWGLGVPVSGSAFQALTPATVASNIGLNVPRT
jgi:hypothetical protein